MLQKLEEQSVETENLNMNLPKITEKFDKLCLLA